MQKYRKLSIILLLVMMALSLQSCLGIGDNDPFQGKDTGNNGRQVGVNGSQQARFKGKIYFTLDRNLTVLDGNGNLTRLTHDMDVRDPAVSPDGKWVAFINRFKNYSDLVYRSTNPADQTIHVVVTGNGNYAINGEGSNSYYWFAQPSWSPDGTRLLFLSDLQKLFVWSSLGGVYASSYFLDMQVFSLPINVNVTLTAKQAITKAQIVGYGYFGDGGNRDPSYRPNHPEQVAYTVFRYAPEGGKQLVQIYLIDTNMMDKGKYRYTPGNDPSVAITPETPDLVNFQPAFSPDGNTIAYVRRENATSMSINIMPVAEGVTSDPNDPYFNPNNKDNMAKALIPYNTQSTQILNNHYVSSPSWSPDGKQMIYYSYDSDNNFNLWMFTLAKDPKTGALSVKKDSKVELLKGNGALDGDAHPSWITA